MRRKHNALGLDRSVNWMRNNFCTTIPASRSVWVPAAGTVPCAALEVLHLPVHVRDGRRLGSRVRDDEEAIRITYGRCCLVGRARSSRGRVGPEDGQDLRRWEHCLHGVLAPAVLDVRPAVLRGGDQQLSSLQREPFILDASMMGRLTWSRLRTTGKNLV